MKIVALLLLMAGPAAWAQTDAHAEASPHSHLPAFDPGAEVASWNGQTWSVTNNRLFDARFERYLSTPTDTDQDTTEHFKVLSRIRELLAPSNVSVQSREEAFRLLDHASDYQADDFLSDTIANQVYSAWLAQKNSALLQAATETMEKERKRLEWNLQVLAQGGSASAQPQSGAQPAPDGRREIEAKQINTRLAEVNHLLKFNRLKTDISWQQAKIEFQSLVVQLFLQRRFQHVLIATGFYRSIFADGNSQQIQFSDEAQSLLPHAGVKPTLTSLDSISGQMISEAADGVAAFRTLLAANEMESATKRLSEAFLIGEYLTALDVITMQKKHQALVFLQQSRQLANALEVKNYTLAEKLVTDLQTTAKDYDVTKAKTAIQTAKTASAIHLAKARNAAASGDKATQEAELQAATELWPTNPALAEVAAGIYSSANEQARALAELDQLVSQRNWRQIYNERMRFIPAVAAHPEKQAKLREVIDNIMMIDRTIERAQDLEKRGEIAGAWETTELVYRRFPEYPRLIKFRAEFASQAADYIEAIAAAERLEAQCDLGASLSWYLQAQMIYPLGELAKAGIQRVNHLILPDSW